MKAYKIRRDAEWPYDERLREDKAGDFVSLADIQAWALKLKEVVDEFPHLEECEALEFDADDSECNCPRGEALRLLGEI